MNFVEEPITCYPCGNNKLKFLKSIYIYIILKDILTVRNVKMDICNKIIKLKL